MKRIIILIIVSVLSIHLKGQDTTVVNKAYTQRDYRTFMRGGNKLYHADNPVEAETAYRKALEADNKSSKAAFNLGDALYKQQKYDKATEQFELAASEMTDKEDKAKAYYNLGNSLLQQQKLEEGIDAYKKSLRNNPNDKDAKYNLSYAMNMLEQQQQQEKDKKSDPDKNQNENQNKDQDKQNKDQNKDQDKQDQNKESDKEQDQQDQNDPQQKPEDQDQQRQDQTQQQHQEKQLSRENAQKMLDAIAQDEKALQEKLQKKERAGQRGKIEKNW